MVLRPCRSAGARVQEASRSSVWRWRRAQVLLPGARRLAWSVKTVGWGQGGGLKIPQMEVIWCHPISGETLVTDGRVDDRLVWWFQHSKLSAVTGSSLPGRDLRPLDRASDCHRKRPVRGHLTGRDLWAAMLDGDVTHGWMAWVGGSWMENDGIYTTSLTCTNTPHSRGARKRVHLRVVEDP